MGKKEELAEIRRQIKAYERQKSFAQVSLFIGFILLIFVIGIFIVIPATIALFQSHNKIEKLKIQEAKLM